MKKYYLMAIEKGNSDANNTQGQWIWNLVSNTPEFLNEIYEKLIGLEF